MVISPKTRLVGLIGHPVKHSMSPKLHNHLYGELGLDMRYMAFDVALDDLHNAVRGMQALGFAGFNVTIPYKEKIIALLDDLDSEARSIGAVNTVKIDDGRLTGYNTDGEGFIQSLIKCGVVINDKNILIIGSGGAARAISIYLAKQDPKMIMIHNRSYERAVALTELINDYKGRKLAQSAQDIIPNADIIINTTSLGMWPQIEGNPLKDVKLKNNTIVCDIVYNPEITNMLKYAQHHGCSIVGGMDMLIGQGLKSVEIWLNKQLPDHAWDVMFGMVHR